MKRKPLIIIGIILGVFLCVIFIWPIASVWQRLGIEPFCIQTSGSKIQIMPCSESAGPAAVSPRPLPTPSEEGPIPLIVDDDGSPDGMLALLFFLRNPLFDVKAVTISSGEAIRSCSPLSSRICWQALAGQTSRSVQVRMLHWKGTTPFQSRGGRQAMIFGVTRS